MASKDQMRYRKTYSYYRVQPRTQELEIIADESLDWKHSVRAASTGNVALTGSTPLAVDGVTLVADDRVLLKNQGTASQNGIYYVEISGGSYTLTRDTDAKQGTLTCGAATYVEEGSTNAGRIYIMSTTGAITVGTTSLTWTQFTGAGGGTPGGADTQVQFNDGGSFGGVSGLTFNKTTGALTGTYVLATTGFSGSLTKLTDGTSYILAGPNITINTGSNGAVQITGSAGGGGVTGTGTAYKHARFSAASTIENSLLEDGRGDGPIGLPLPGTLNFLTSSAEGFHFPSAQRWTVAPSNTRALVINEDGFVFNASARSVGIGTANPADPLHIAHYSFGSDSAFIGSSMRTIRLQNTSTTAGNSTSIVNIGNVGIGNSDINAHISFINLAVDSAAITFGTKQNASSFGERMRIDEAGNVGIGSITPTSIGADVFLFVSGSSGSLGTSTRGVAAFGGDVIVSGSLKIGTGSVFITTNDIQFGTPDIRIQKNGNDMKFFDITNPSGLTLSELASGGGGGSSPEYWLSPSSGVIYATGSVGIGTSSISSRLHVSGSGTGATTTLTVRHGVANGSSLPVLNVQNSAGDSLLYVSGSGFVGIGTTTQSALADLVIGTGATIVSVASSGVGSFPGAGILFEVNNTLSGAILVSDAGMTVGGGAGRELFLISDDDTKVAVTPGGLVRIIDNDSYFDADVNSGQGIKLASSPGNAGAQVLDAYYEADLSAVIDCSGNEGNGVYVLDVAYDTLKMTRVGRLVTIGGDLRIDSLGDTPSGRLYILLGTTSGQYPSMDTAASVYVTGAIDLSSAIATSVQAYVEASTSKMYIDGYLDGSKVDIATQVGAGVTIKISVTYAV